MRFRTLSPPRTYLGRPRLAEIAARHGARVALRPYDFQRIVPQSGGRAGPRRRYRDLELERWSRHLGGPLNVRPRHYPRDVSIDNRSATHAVIAAQPILRAPWAEERNTADRAAVIAIANENALPDERLFAPQGAAAVSAGVRAQFERGAAVRRVRRSDPCLPRRGPFWGQDRLDFLDRTLRDRRPRDGTRRVVVRGARSAVESAPFPGW